MFFRTKNKKDKEKIEHYQIFIEEKEDEIRFDILYWGRKEPLSSFLKLVFEILDDILGNASVFIIDTNFAQQNNEQIKYLMQHSQDAEFLFSEDMIIEKRRGIHSLLLRVAFQIGKDGQVEHDFRDFLLYGYEQDVEMQKTWAEQQDFFWKYKADFTVFYEEVCEGPIVEMRMKKGIYSPEALMRFSIKTCKKYEKDIELIYRKERNTEKARDE